MEKKKVQLANFNITFGDDKEPMLNYFDSIIYPTFTSNLHRKYRDDDYYFINNVKVMKLNNEYALVGFFIKSTQLEIKSKIVGNKLENTDEVHPAAPFSTFVILLKNHRMFLIKNQKKGSPDIRSFNTTVRSLLKQYIHNINNGIENTEEKLPLPIVNIVGLPSNNDIMTQLKSVKKITQFTMRLYPLNDDLPGTDLEEQLANRIKATGANTGSNVVNSPSNKKEIAKIITKTEGRAEPILNVVYEGGGTGSIRNEVFTENIELPIDGETISSIANEAYYHLKDRPELNVTSTNHQNTLQRNINKILNYLTNHK
jgi:hypothetical protein